MDWSGWVIAGATITLALTTGLYVMLTKKLLDTQTDPCVIVSTLHDANRPTIIQLVIKNVGPGLASDVTFKCSRPMPRFAKGLTVEEASDAETMVAGPLIDGISGLAPGEERRIDWGQYGGLVKALGSEPVLITSTFKKNKKDMSPVVSTVDVKSYKGTAAARSLYAEVASDINKISNNIEHLTSGFKALRIERTDNDKHDKPLGRNGK